MVRLGIDYNGQNGFDGFVTDASLARRVSLRCLRSHADEWVHLAFAWDETRAYVWVNGRPAARKEARAVYCRLDQFGPHSRIIARLPGPERLHVRARR